ncbi:MAG TPA: hypothetical protein PLY54_05550, partial [Ottowia sp.]|nr:hypothetical protein [Ottowia sp.]
TPTFHVGRKKGLKCRTRVFKTIDFVLPPSEVVEHFEAIAAPMAGQMLALQRQIQTLRRTRDLLLPRLLSGQIAVEAMDHA